MVNLICEQQVLLSKRFVNVIADWIWEQQVLSRWDKSHQHINIMHIDTRYTWKPIKGENHILLLLWCKGKLQLPLTTVFCRHQPTGGSILNSASYNLQGSSNSHQFSAGTNLQEAPTSVSYDWHFIKLQLDVEAPTPIYFLQAPTYRRLLPQSATTDIYQATTW